MLRAHKDNHHKKNSSFLSAFLSTIFLSIIGASIIGINFIFFITTKEYNIFSQFKHINIEVAIILSGVILLAIFINIISSFSRLLQALITSLIFALFTHAFINQTQIHNIDNFIKPYFNDLSNLIIPGTIGLISLAFLLLSGLKTKFYASCVILITFISFASYTYVKKPQNNTTPQTINNKTDVTTKDNNNKFIYISIKNQPSYTSIKNQDKHLANMVYGFFEANNFKFYPSSYNKKDENINTFITTFNKGSYKTTSYQDNNTCTSDTNTCIINNINSINTNKREFSIKDKSIILTSQWINSFTNINIPFLNNHKYKSIYTINSLNVLQQAFDNINKDKTQSAYFINITLADNNYIYDRYCNIKPTKNWNHSLASINEQTHCIFAYLQEQMNKIETQNIVYIITFGNEDDSSFAILDPIQKQFIQDNRTCSINELFGNYLYKKEDCQTNKKTRQAITQNTGIINQSHIKTFKEWYNQYKKVKHID